MKYPVMVKSLVASVLIFSAGLLGATETATFESSAEYYSSDGGSASFDVSFDYTGSTLSTLGLSIDLPTGWNFASASGPSSPPIVPDPGTTANAEFAYFSVPANAINFTVTLDYAAGLTGDQSIGGTVLYKISGNSTNLNATLSPITLVAAVAPAFSSQPESTNVNLGGSVSFSAVATGVPTPTFQWQKDGSDLSGATSNTLTLNPVSASDAGAYTLVATNSLGSVTSSAADLTVNLPPTITADPVAKIVAKGTSTTFEVTATGSGTLSYQWRKNGTEITGADSAVLGLSNVQTSDAGSYDVVVSNFVGSVTSAAVTLSVQVPVSITTQPTSQTAIAGDSVSLSVGASGDPAPTYQWRKDGTPIAGQTSTSLNLGAVSLSDAADYDVVVTNALGSVTSEAAILTVHVPVSISVAPQSQTLTTGSTLTLTVVADGFPAPTYQWRKNGEAISGATSATYAKSDVTPDDSGSYDVVVTNVVGSETSAAATVTVQSLPVISAQPTGGVFLVGGAGELTVEASGGSALTYQWRKGGAAVSGATSATLVFTGLTLDDAGSFDVVVTNSAGSVTSDAVEVAVVELTGSHSYGGKGYRAGKVLTVNNTLTYAGNLTSFGWSVMPPDAVGGQKWTFDASGGSAGQVAPQAGDTDLFEWAWTSTPASPIEFSYTLNVPANVTGEQTLTAVVRARFSGTEVSTMVNPDPLTVPVAPSTHHADFDQDNKINLSELLRVIELYNTREGTRRTGAYRAEEGTVDGFAPGPEQ